MVADEPDRNYCLLLGYELLYLWNALGACLKHSHASIQIGEWFVHSSTDLVAGSGQQS